jgi:hypothetical protein
MEIFLPVSDCVVASPKVRRSYLFVKVQSKLSHRVN